MLRYLSPASRSGGLLKNLISVYSVKLWRPNRQHEYNNNSQETSNICSHETAWKFVRTFKIRATTLAPAWKDLSYFNTFQWDSGWKSVSWQVTANHSQAGVGPANLLLLLVKMEIFCLHKHQCLNGLEFSWLLSTSMYSSCELKISDSRYVFSSCPSGAASSLPMLCSFSFSRGITFSCRKSRISDQTQRKETVRSHPSWFHILFTLLKPVSHYTDPNRFHIVYTLLKLVSH